MVQDNRTVGQLTLHTLRFLCNDHNHVRLFEQATSPTDIKRIIWNIIKPTIKTEEERVGFLKGIKLCDFDALYQWKVTNMDKQ